MSASLKPENYEILTSKYSHTCNHLKKCQSFKRIKHILNQYYTLNKTITDIKIRMKLITESVTTYTNLINDYHHIIIKHLSHSNHIKNIENFNYINSNLLKCDILTCNDYINHNKNRLNISYVINKQISFYIDYLSSIHIHFIHGFDSGFRTYTTPNVIATDPNNNIFDQDMINKLLLFNFGDRDDIISAIRCAKNKNDIYEIIDILENINANKQTKLREQLNSSEFYEDNQMISIKNHIQSKQKYIINLRGYNRWKNNKFSTHIETSIRTSITQEARRKSSKMNKLLPAPVDIQSNGTNSSKYIIKDGTIGTFTVLLNQQLFIDGINEDILDELNEWIEEHNYDTDGIIEDIKIAQAMDNDESNLYQFCCLKNQIKCFNKIKQFVDGYTENDIITMDNKPRKSSGSEEKQTRDYGCDAKSEDENLSYVKKGSKEYVFGQRYYYWDKYKYNFWHINC
eukprot:148754_1